MSKDTKVEKTEAAKPKRTRLTEAERIAKLEAELKAARDKAAAKERKQVAALQEQRTKLIAKAKEIEAKVTALEDQINELGGTIASAPAAPVTKATEV